MAKPGHRSDKSAARIRSESGETVGSVLLMINLEGKHRAQNGVCQMIVAGIAGEIGVKMLDSMIHMLFGGNLFVVAVQLCFAVLFRAVFCNLCSGKDGVGWQKVKGIRRSGLFAAAFVGFSWHVGLNAQDHRHGDSSFS